MTTPTQEQVIQELRDRFTAMDARIAAVELELSELTDNLNRAMDQIRMNAESFALVAERVSDMIRGRTLLPSIDVPVWIDEHWRTRQRSGTPSQSGP